MSHQLEFCKKCIKKSFSSSQGIVCGLTNEKPAFSTHCPDFEKDVKEEKRMIERKAVEAADDLYDETGKPVPAWRIGITIIIVLFAVVRIFYRCSSM